MTIKKNVNKNSSKNSISRKAAAGLLAVLVLCVFSFISIRNTYAEEGEAELPVSDEEAFAYLQHFLVYAHSRCMKRALEETQTAAAE